MDDRRSIDDILSPRFSNTGVPLAPPSDGTADSRSRRRGESPQTTPDNKKTPDGTFAGHVSSRNLRPMALDQLSARDEASARRPSPPRGSELGPGRAERSGRSASPNGSERSPTDATAPRMRSRLSGEELLARNQPFGANLRPIPRSGPGTPEIRSPRSPTPSSSRDSRGDAPPSELARRRGVARNGRPLSMPPRMGGMPMGSPQMSRTASRETSRESTLRGSSILSPVGSSRDEFHGGRPRSRRGVRSGSVSGSDSGRLGINFLGFDHSPSELVHRIVHPLFQSMQEPEARSRRTRASDLKPRAFRPNSSKGVDPAGAIIELGKDFAELILKKSKDKKTMKSARGLPVEMILAGLSLGFFIAGVERAPHIELKHVPDIDPGELLDTWHVWQYHAKNPQPLRPLDRKGLEFAWIHEDRTPVAHLERLAAAAKTLQFGYNLLRRHNRLPSMSYLIQGTELIEDVSDEPYGDGMPVEIEFAKGDVIEIAVTETGKGNKVAVVSAASAFQVGSGFLTGGCHHLGAEEALCMQSTLFFSLQRAAVLAEEQGLQDSMGHPVHIPERGAVVSPGVEVFRHGVETGYAPMQQPVEIEAIVSMSMPNRNSSLKDVPIDKRSGPIYEKFVESKFKAALTGAARAGARVLVVPKVGCGEFENLPADVGRAFGRTLASFNGYFDTVIVAGSHEMYDAAKKCYEALEPSNMKSANETKLQKDIIGPLLTLSHQLLSGSNFGKVAGKTSWAAMGVNPMRSEMTRQLGSELKVSAASQAREISKEKDARLAELLTRYGAAGSRRVPSWRLNELLKEWYHGEMPPYEELRFVTRSSNPRANMRLIPAREIVESIRAYELYQQFKKDIEIIFYLYDGDGTGQLEESQVIRVLYEMSGEALSLEQVMAIMRHADINYDGSISRLEFAIMVVRWQSMMANYYAEDPLVLPIKGFPWFQVTGTAKAWREECLAACGPAQRTHSIAPVISQDLLDRDSDYRRQFML